MKSKISILLVSSFLIFVLFSIISITGLIWDEQDSSFSLDFYWDSPDGLNLGETTPGERLYTDTLFIKINSIDGNEVQSKMTIIGTNFYDSDSSGAHCPITNEFDLENIRYFATNGEYSTLNDPRADEEGYVPIINFQNSEGNYVDPRGDVIINNPLGNVLSGESIMSIKFRIDIPEKCIMDIDTGSIKIIGTDPENEDFTKSFYFIPKISVKPIIDLKLISEIILKYRNTKREEIILEPREFLFWGNQIIFDIQVGSNHPRGAEWIDKIYITINDELKINCIPNELINTDHQNYHCILTIESPESMHGLTQINVEAISYDTDYKKNMEIGSWFLNPVLATDIHGNIIFQETNSGQKVYSDIVTIKNAGESNAPLYMFISKNNTISSIFYYAKSGEYNTLHDPRADEEGYIPINLGERFNDPNIFINSYEIMYPTESLINSHPGNKLEVDESITLRFRYNTSEDFNGNINDIVYIWGTALQGPSLGSGIPFNLKVTDPITCNTNLDCGENKFINDTFCLNRDVFKEYQSYSCINPGTTESICEENILPKLIEDCETGCFEGRCLKCNKTCLSADINNDNKIGLSDWGIFRFNYGRTDCNLFDWCNGADINNDSNVDINDFSILKENFGKKCCIK